MSPKAVPCLDGYVEFRRGKYRFVPHNKVLINRGTPVGDPADFYERMPYGGRRSFEPLLRISNGSIVEGSYYPKRWNKDKKKWENFPNKEVRGFIRQLKAKSKKKTRP